MSSGDQGRGDDPPARRPGQEEARPLPKRFFKDATVGTVKDRQYPVLLDGRPVKTQKKSALQLPTKALAEAIAAEWQAQRERIDPATMPLTRLANTALDGVTGQEIEVRADVVKYAGSDLLCYRAEQPRSLIDAQARAWDPVLVWGKRRLGVTFAVATVSLPRALPRLAFSLTTIATSGNVWQLHDGEPLA